MKNITIIVVLLLLQYNPIFSQEDKAQEETVVEAKKMVAEGNNFLVSKSNFPQAEGAYRKAIAKNPVDATAKYNLGNAYYYEKKYDEANQRFSEATQVAKTKTEKHKAFHNQGNNFMEQKKYEAAVKAYKNALRNNPKDEETRYNLALAKKMLEKQEQENKDKNKDDKENKDNKDQKDKGEDKNKDDKDQGDDKKDKGDQGEDKDKEGKDQKDKKEDQQGDDKKDKGDQGDNKDKKEGGDEDKKEGQGDKEQQGQPKSREGQLSPQQVQRLLEAMNNQEKKVQDKLNAKKTQGIKVKTDKDW